MKKKGKIILCAVLAFLLIAGCVTWSFLPHPLNYPINQIEAAGSTLEVLEETEDSVTVTKKGDGEFKILMFTDMHLDGKNKTSYTTVSHLVENIQHEKPDLVLLGGDNVTSGMNGVRAKQLGRIFEKLGVYWAGVLGNHEGDNVWSVSREKMMDIFTSFDHCLMKKGPADIDGNCNYALHILDADGGMLQTFFFLDTFDMVADADKPQLGFAESDKVTDGAHKNQIEWYARKAAAVKEAYGDYASILVQHVPLLQHKAAAETEEFLYGVKLEGVCCTSYDNGLFDAIRASGVTHAVFCGHDHMNSFAVRYEGVVLSYIEPSGYGSYNTGTKLGYEEKDWLQGYTRLTLHADRSFTAEQMRNSAL